MVVVVDIFFAYYVIIIIILYLSYNYKHICYVHFILYTIIIIIMIITTCSDDTVTPILFCLVDYCLSYVEFLEGYDFIYLQKDNLHSALQFFTITFALITEPSCHF